MRTMDKLATFYDREFAQGDRTPYLLQKSFQRPLFPCWPCFDARVKEHHWTIGESVAPVECLFVEQLVVLKWDSSVHRTAVANGWCRRHGWRRIKMAKEHVASGPLHVQII